MQNRSNALRLLKWVNNYPGWWYLICTPDPTPQLSLSMVQTLIKALHKAELDELIFVMLMVHREDAVMRRVLEYALLDRLIDRWGNDSEKIIRELVAIFI